MTIYFFLIVINIILIIYRIWKSLISSLCCLYTLLDNCLKMGKKKRSITGDGADSVSTSAQIYNQVSPIDPM